MCSTACDDRVLKRSGKNTTKSSSVSIILAPKRVCFTSAFFITIGVSNGRALTLFIGGRETAPSSLNCSPKSDILLLLLLLLLLLIMLMMKDSSNSCIHMGQMTRKIGVKGPKIRARKIGAKNFTAL
nr:uncharacterized protein LOC118878535 [Drosophila suzukii]